MQGRLQRYVRGCRLTEKRVLEGLRVAATTCVQEGMSPVEYMAQVTLFRPARCRGAARCATRHQRP